ncbi:MAG: hypothetical protein F4Y02_15730, partial [Chloroflexi bacterium]|nr:hypothetical protein [Chloroflexota bacterium]
MKDLGVNPSSVDTSSGFHAGTRGRTDDFREFMYQRAGEAIRRHDAVEIRGDTGQAWALDGDRVSGEAGNVVGVSHEDVAAGEYGWFQVYGPGSVRTVQETVVKGAELWPGPAASQGALSSATLGRPVDGINVMAEGADSLAPVFLSYPRIAATASTGTGASNVPDKPSAPAATTQYNLQVTDTGQASWQPDGGTTDTDPTARAAAAAADAKAVAAQATADGKSNVPDRPATPDAATDYNLRVQADGTASWEEDTVQDTGLPEAPGAQAATARYELEVGTDGAATWQTASDGGGEGLTDAERARLLPELPSEGSRDNKVPKFDGDTLGWEVDATAAGGTGLDEAAVDGRIDTLVPPEKRLPDLPAAGSRDNRIPKFDGDVLGWEVDAAEAAQAEADDNAVRIQHLNDVTKDLSLTAKAVWVEGTDASLCGIAILDEVSNDNVDVAGVTFASTIANPRFPFTPPSTQKQLVIRLKDTEDQSDWAWAITFPDTDLLYHTHWVPKEVDNGTAGYSYFLGSPIPGGSTQTKAAVYKTTHETSYGGEVTGTFKDGVVPLDALAPDVRSAIASGGGDDSLIEKLYDDTVLGSAAIFSVEGVTVADDANTAFYFRVNTTSEFTLGNALFAAASGSAITVDGIRFWTLADGSLRIGSTTTDKAVVVWKVDDIGAIRTTIQQAGAAAGDDGGIADGLEPLEPLDGDGLSVGDVVLSGHALHRYATPGTANAFAGVLGTYREGQLYYLVTSRSDSHFGAHGRFTDNHDAAIGAVLVGQGTNNVMEVQIDKAAYETAKGSAVASGDQISAAFTGTVAGSETTTTHVLPYVRSFTVGGKTWLSFEGQAPNSVPKRVGTHPDGWSLIVSQGGSVLLTHAVDDSHFTEYPIEGIDQAARDAANAAAGAANVRDALQTLTGDARLDASAVKDLPQPVAGLAGLRTESISFQEDVAESPGDELSPLAQDPVAVVHGDGDPEMLTGLSGNDFTVAPGLYFIQATGNQDGAGIGHFALQFRQSSDNAVIAAMPNVFFYNTGEQPFTASAYWHVTEAVEVNLFLARFDSRAVGVADLVMSFARLTAEDTADRHVIEPLEPLDTDEANDGEVVLSEHEFYVRQPGHGTANTFAGELERWTDGADTWLGTAIRNSVYGQRGQFSSNPDSNVGVLLAGISTDDADTVDLWIRKAAYDAAVGRAANSGDTVKAVITADVDGTATTTTTELTYAVFHGDSGYYSFSAIDPNNVLHNLADGAAWSMVVNRANDNPLLTHAAGAAHFVEYPIRGAIDQYARDEVARALSEITLSFEQSRYPSNETFTIPEVGTNGVSEHDPLILAARGNVLIGHYFGDSDHFGRSEDLNLGIEGIATEDAASGSVKMLSWGLVTGVPMGPQYTHSQLQTASNAPPGKPVYVTSRDSRVRPGGSTDNRNTNADLTYWTLDPDESADDEIYGYCVGWEGATGTNQQGVYSVIFDFRRVP